MEHIQKQKATREETDQEGEERDEKEDTEKDKRARGPSCKLFWSDLKGGHQNKKRSIPRLKSRNGRTIEEPTDVLEELAKHWEDLGKQQTDGGRMIAEMEDRREGIGLDMCEMVTWQQVLDVVRCLRRGKSPGPDGILNEMMVYGGFRLMETLAQLMNLAITEKYVPSEWRKLCCAFV